MGPDTSSQLEGRGAFAAAYLVHAALALLILGVTITRPVNGIPQPTDLRLWFPLGFVVASILVYVMAARVRPQERNSVLTLDLVAWLALPACIIACRLNPAWTPAWLSAALGMKTFACVEAIFMAARARQSPRLAGLALATQFLNLSLVALPYTRYPGMPNAVGLTGDEPAYLAESSALYYDHSFYVGRVYTSPLFKNIVGRILPRGAGQAWYVGNGHYAPAHDLGLSILAIPFFAVAGDLGVEIAMAVLAAATVYLTYRLVVAIGFTSEVAVLIVVVSCFLVPFVTYATQVFTEIPLAFGAVAAAFYVVGTSRSRLGYVGVTVTLAILPWVHDRAWGLIVPLLIGLAVFEKSWKRRLVAPIVVVVSELAYLVLLRLIYGHFMINHPQTSFSTDLAALTPSKLLIDLESPFLDPVHGLFLVAPVFLIAFAAWPLLVRTVRGGWVLVLAVVAYTLELGVTAPFAVSGASSPLGRLMVCCAPLLAPALALGLVRLRVRGWSAILWLLAGFGVLVTFAVFANRRSAYPPGAISGLASLLPIRGPRFTVTGHGPLYAGLLVIAALIALALLVGWGGPRGDAAHRPAKADSESAPQST